MKNCIYIIILSINFSFIFTYIKIPFKTFIWGNKIDLSKFKNNYIYINISMGLPNLIPNQNRILIQQEKYHFYFYKNHSYPYDKIISNEIDINNSLCKKGIYMNDIMQLGTNVYQNISFILCTKYYEMDSLYFDGQLGLSMGYENKYDTNLIRQLKAKKYINNYCYSIIYENNEQGFLLLGEFPHNVNKELNNNKFLNYNEENLYWIPAVKNEKNPRWSITFDKISYSNSELFQIQRNCIFSIENKFIISPSQYFNLVKEIFGKKCKVYLMDFNFQFLSCDKDINKEFTPQINFFIKEFNVTFSFDYNDLFVEAKNSLVFLVGNNAEIEEGHWTLGKPFFKKYLVLFNMDSKMVGFYTKEKEKNIEINSDRNKNISKFNTSIFINVLLFIVIIILSFALYHCYVNKRRIRANELEDKFNYIAKRDENEIKEIK